MFDASHGFGCTTAGVPLGNFGQCEVFSFHATKFFNTFEGGAVVTNSDPLAEKMRLMRNFGFLDYDQVVYPGTNGKMTEIAAAMSTIDRSGTKAPSNCRYSNGRERMNLSSMPRARNAEAE